jgi:hypothetical protein
MFMTISAPVAKNPFHSFLIGCGDIESQLSLKFGGILFMVIVPVSFAL